MEGGESEQEEKRESVCGEVWCVACGCVFVRELPFIFSFISKFARPLHNALTTSSRPRPDIAKKIHTNYITDIDVTTRL